MITNLAVFLLGTTRLPEPPEVQLSEYDTRIVQIATSWGSQLQHLYFVFGMVRADDGGKLRREDYKFLQKHCHAQLSSMEHQTPASSSGATSNSKPVAIISREKKRIRKERATDRITRRLSSAEAVMTGPIRNHLRNSTTLYNCPSNATGGPEVYPSIAINVLLTANCTRFVYTAIKKSPRMQQPNRTLPYFYTSPRLPVLLLHLTQQRILRIWTNLSLSRVHSLLLQSGIPL
jgi:hypothetical protein